jgi:hypothetical protein
VTLAHIQHGLPDQFSSRQKAALYRSIMSDQFRLCQNDYVKRKRYWISASISRINRDSTFGATFQDELLVDLVGNLTPRDLFKHRRSPTVTATDGSEEAESGCDDGSEYDESSCDAEDGRRRLLRLRTASFILTPSYLSPQGLLDILEPRASRGYPPHVNGAGAIVPYHVSRSIIARRVDRLPVTGWCARYSSTFAVDPHAAFNLLGRLVSVAAK